MASRTVFCSYARRDGNAVSALASDLEKLGQEVWFDQQLSGGQRWWETILEKIRRCDCFLMAVSSASVRSNGMSAPRYWGGSVCWTVTVTASPAKVGSSAPVRAVFARTWRSREAGRR